MCVFRQVGVLVKWIRWYGTRNYVILDPFDEDAKVISMGEEKILGKHKAVLKNPRVGIWVKKGYGGSWSPTNF